MDWTRLYFFFFKFQKNSTIEAFLQILCEVFAERPPVFKKSALNPDSQKQGKQQPSPASNRALLYEVRQGGCTKVPTKSLSWIKCVYKFILYTRQGDKFLKVGKEYNPWVKILRLKMSEKWSWYNIKREHQGAGMAQWWERSPPTNVARVRFRHGAIRGSSLLLVLVLASKVLLRVLRFSTLHKNQHFQIPKRSGLRTRMKTSKGWCAFLSKYSNF